MTQKIKQFLYDKTGLFKLTFLSSPLFIFGLIAKLYAATFFAGDNFTNLFAPFLKSFVLQEGSPYQLFFQNGLLEVFPYPQLMLYVMSVIAAIFSPLLSPDIFTITYGDSLLFHLPILVADLVILIVLSRWLKNKHTELLWLYWLSPILFYINYIHSQLDAVPIALTFVFLYFLFKEKWFYAFIFLGAAIATKFHIVILLPFTLIYLWRRRVSKVFIGFFAAIPILIFLVINNVQLVSQAFLTIVFANREQGKVFDLQIALGSEHVLYIIPFAYILLFLHALTFTRFNRDTFVMFLGFSFGILTLGIPPMQGWYYWILPFLIYFYVKNDQFSKIPFATLVVAYFIHFALIPESDYVSIFSAIAPGLASLPNPYELIAQAGIEADLVSNLALSFLQACLFMNVLWLYRRGVEESKKQKLYNMPYLIGIAGDSGSGKSTLTDLFVDLFGTKHVAIVSGDAMHKWERGDTMWSKFTHLDPRANRLHYDLEYVRQLQSGQDIYRRHYDHHTGKFSTPDKLESKSVVLFEGLHSFFLTEMQQVLDLKVFIKPDDQLRTHWKVKRDMADRGYTKDKVLAQLKNREQDAKEYVEVQEKYADITFSLKSLIAITETDIGTDIDVPVYLEIKCDNKVYLEPFLETLSTYVNIEHTFNDKHQIVSLTGSISGPVLEHLSYSLVPDLFDIVTEKPHWSSDHRGIMQFFISYYILNSLNYNRQSSPTKTLRSNATLTDIVRSANLIGNERTFVQGGGGNVSVKLNHDTMAVKASGLRLEELQETSGFVGIDYTSVRRFFNTPRENGGNVDGLADSYNVAISASKVPLPGYPDTQLRPSIETGFHAILDTVVIHTHSVFVNILTCSIAGKDILKKLFPTAAFVPYYTPGASLTFALSQLLKTEPYTVFFLENHGVIVSGKTVADTHSKHAEINTVIKKHLRLSNEFPVATVVTGADGRLVSNHTSLKAFIIKNKDLLPTFNETILFPDQVVYCTKFGFEGDNKPITIDRLTGEITYDNVSYKEALAFIETFVAWVYIESEIHHNNLTHKLIPAEEGEHIVNMDSEKYRQKLIS